MFYLKPFFEKPDDKGGADPEAMQKLIQAEAQKIADAMVAKKLKDMPTKEEVAAFKQWQEAQAKPEVTPEMKALQEKLEALQAQSDELAKEAEANKTKATKLERERLAISAGVTQDYAEFVAYKVGALVTDEKAYDVALTEYLDENKQFKGQIKTGTEFGAGVSRVDGVTQAFYELNDDLKK